MAPMQHRVMAFEISVGFGLGNVNGEPIGLADQVIPSIFLHCSATLILDASPVQASGMFVVGNSRDCRRNGLGGFNDA